MARKKKYFHSATGGADSGPASLEGTPTDDKNGQQAFGAGESRYYFFLLRRMSD